MTTSGILHIVFAGAFCVVVFFAARFLVFGRWHKRYMHISCGHHSHEANWNLCEGCGHMMPIYEEKLMRARILGGWKVKK